MSLDGCFEFCYIQYMRNSKLIELLMDLPLDAEVSGVQDTFPAHHSATRFTSASGAVKVITVGDQIVIVNSGDGPMVRETQMG